MISPSKPAAGRDITGRLAVGAGIAAAAVALAVAEILAGLIPGTPSLILAVGARIIDLQPAGAKELMVDLFGEADKAVLEVAIVGSAMGIGAALGWIGRRRFPVAAAGLAGAGVAGFAAGLGEPGATPALTVVAAAGAAAAGIWVLSWLLGRLAPPVPADMGDSGEVRSIDGSSTADLGRRGILLRAGGLIVGSIALGWLGRQLLLERQANPGIALGPFPPPVRTAGLPPGADLGVPGLGPIVTPNADFYRIDTALLVPRIEVDAWSLRIHGLVERETTLRWSELTGLPLVEQFVTIACVSNEVGGDLIGNAKWTGVRLREVLAIAGVRPEATQLVGRSVDDWTAGMPVEWIMDPAREALVAILMNDEPLPRRHGAPARLIVPGLYGYVSATKWLTELELTTMEAFDAFWIPRGWAKEAPILTQSRIDVPRRGARVPAGPTAVAGVAWAVDRGIESVEVAVDDGDWRPATLSIPISGATWVQWRLTWEATSGRHSIAVRAVDGAGEVQTDRRTRPAPDGARGHHAITVEVA